MNEAGPSRRALAGQVVIVTGGAGGIGTATCEAAAREGASVVVADLDDQGIDQTLARLRANGPSGPEHLGLRVDVSRPEDNQAMARSTLDRFGRIDALVASAGILRPGGQPPKPLVDVALEEWERVLAVNLRGVFLSNQAVLPTMIQQRRGTIVNVSSVQGLVGRANDGPYCASKFGVTGLSQCIAEEVKGYGVKVMAIMPHAVDTAMWEQNRPMPKPGNALPPERVADLILFILTQPADTVLLGAVIAPLGARRRRQPSQDAGDAAAPGRPATTQ